MPLRLESAGPPGPLSLQKWPVPDGVKTAGRLLRRQVLSKTTLAPSRVYLHPLSRQQDKNKNQILAEPQRGGSKRWNSGGAVELQGLAHVARQERVALQATGTRGAVPAKAGRGYLWER